MTVKELITELQKYPEDFKVTTEDEYYGAIEVRKVVLYEDNVNIE